MRARPGGSGGRQRSKIVMKIGLRNAWLRGAAARRRAARRRGEKRGANCCLGGRRAGLPGGLARLAGARSRRVRGVARLLRDQATGGGRWLPRHLLVEDVLGLRLRQGVPVGYGLDGRVVPGGRPAGRADPRRVGGLADVGEHALDWNVLGNGADDAHSVRYPLDCRRSCSQRRRPFRVATTWPSSEQGVTAISNQLPTDVGYAQVFPPSVQMHRPPPRRVRAKRADSGWGP